MKTHRLTQSLEGLALSMERFGTGVMPNCWDILHTLSIPTLLMVGEFDLKYRGIAESIMKSIPVDIVEQVLVSNVGHCAHLEGIDNATDQLRDWLTFSVCET